PTTSRRTSRSSDSGRKRADNSHPRCGDPVRIRFKRRHRKTKGRNASVLGPALLHSPAWGKRTNTSRSWQSTVLLALGWRVPIVRGYELRLSGYGLSDSDDIDVQRAGGDFSRC